MIERRLIECPFNERSLFGPGWRAVLASSFGGFAIVYFALFCAYGTESPFFPLFLSMRGLSASEIGGLLAAGTIVRLVIGPALGILADAVGTRRVLAIAAVAASLLFLLYLPHWTFWPLLAVSLAHSAATAPLSPLADALALRAAVHEGTFSYGWVRGIGSGGFILGTLASGELVARYGLNMILIVAAAFWLLMALPITRLPAAPAAGTEVARGGFATLLKDVPFSIMLLVAGLVIGSHAMSDTFAVIEWRAAGVPAQAIGLLWSEAVASEIFVFVVLGPFLLARLSANRCAVIAAVGGIVRWSCLASSSNIAVLAGTQLLHGLTFSLMHLACMKIIAMRVPENLAATAQMLYGTLCLGLASAFLTSFSGAAYQAIGQKAFWLMSALCLLAIPFAVMTDWRPRTRLPANG